MPDGLEFKDVWRKDEAQVEADVIAMWARDGALTREVDPAMRAKKLCIVAYAGGEPVGVSTVQISVLEPVRTTMAHLRVYVTPSHRAQKLVLSISAATYEAMSRFAQANPGLRIGGTAATVAATPGITKPLTSTGMVLIGYSPEGSPIIVRWFDHYRL